MVKWITITLSTLAVLLSLQVEAQDIHFSHYRGMPAGHNPAFTGAYLDHFQLRAIHRSQWRPIGKPYNTFAATYDQKLHQVPQDIGVGILAVNDQSGEYGLAQTKVMLAGAYHKSQGATTLSAGLQTGLVIKSYGIRNTTYPQQYSRDRGDFDWNLSSGESGQSDQLAYIDVNVGMLSRTEFEWGHLIGGAAIQHLTAPKESFFGNDVRLEPRVLAELRAEIEFGNNFFCLPSYFVQRHNKAHEMLMGIGIGANLGSNELDAERIYGNLLVREGAKRNGDAFIATAAVDFKQFSTAFTYDFNYSDLIVGTGGRGAFEISILYRGLDFTPEKLTLPCDRY